MGILTKSKYKVYFSIRHNDTLKESNASMFIECRGLYVDLALEIQKVMNEEGYDVTVLSVDKLVEL